MKVILAFIAAVVLLWLPLILWLLASQRRARRSANDPDSAARRSQDGAVVAVYCFAVVEVGLLLMGRSADALALAVLAAIPLVAVVRRARRRPPRQEHPLVESDVPV